MEVQLDDFEDGRPMHLQASEETALRIRQLRGKKQYQELLELALTLPSTNNRFLLQANAYLNLKRWKELAQVCEKGLDMATEAEASDFYNLKGKAMGRLGDFQEKARLTARAIELNPKVAAYHRNLGAAYYKLKQYPRAIECHQQAIRLEPKDSINYHNKGAAFFRMKQFQRAKECFQRSVDLNPKQILSHGWLGDTYKEMSQWQLALRSYSRAYEISGQEQYAKSVKDIEDKLQPEKKGFFARIFS